MDDTFTLVQGTLLYTLCHCCMLHKSWAN